MNPNLKMALLAALIVGLFCLGEVASYAYDYESPIPEGVECEL